MIAYAVMNGRPGVLPQQPVVAGWPDVAGGADAAREQPALVVEQARIHRSVGTIEPDDEAPCLAGMNSPVAVPGKADTPDIGAARTIRHIQSKADQSRTMLGQAGDDARHGEIPSLQP